MAYEKKEGEITVFLKKKEYTVKSGDNKGKKDYFWAGYFQVGTQKFDVTTKGNVLAGKDGKPDSLPLNIKRSQGAQNVL